MPASAEASHFLSACTDVASVQERLLRDEILVPNARSAYGEAHGFASVGGLDDYRRRVPLVGYEQLRPAVERMVRGEPGVLTAERPVAFFKTSGSLAAPKLIPVTPSFARDKARAFGIFWHMVHRDHPALRRGKWIANFGDGGQAAHSPAGVDVLSETSFWNRRMQGLQAWAGWPLPAGLRTIPDHALRYYAVARLALAGPLHGIMCLNPSTLLLLCRTIARHRAALVRAIRHGELGYPGEADVDIVAALRPHLKAEPARARQLERALGGDAEVPLERVWPELELIVCWQSEAVEPYLRQLEPYLSGVGRRDYISQASECIMAIPLADGAAGGPLPYTCHFFEFIPESALEAAAPDTLLAWELEEGRTYELVVTTSGGLYRYRMGDCFRVTGFRGRVPLLEFLYRGGKTASITGEKLTEYQVLEAARRAAATSGVMPGEFLCFPRSGPEPHYGVLLNGSPDAPRGLARWLAGLDTALAAVNGEYAEKRRSGRLGSPIGLFIGRDGFEAYRCRLARDGVSEEQVKIGVLTRTLDLDAAFAVQQVIHARYGV